MFQPLDFCHFNKIYEFLSIGGAEDSFSSVTTLKGWQKLFDPQIYIHEDFILTALKADGVLHFRAPLVKSREKFGAAADCIQNAGGRVINLVSGWQADILKEKGYLVSPVRSMAEYIYAAQDLITLKGKKYHAKRNFINGFPLPYTFRTYTPEDYQGVMALMEQWSLASSCRAMGEEVNATSWSYLWDELKISDYDMERAVLQDVLPRLKEYRLFADVLEADGKVIGFAAGEILTPDMGVIHFEKADISYKGIYALLDNLFVKKHFGDVAFVNKQEDLGLEGLRKSKLSYHPVRLAEKFNCKR